MFLLSSGRTFIFNLCFFINKFDLIFASFCIKLEHYIIDLIWDPLGSLVDKRPAKVRISAAVDLL